jgi:hypothetical protein
VPLARLLYRPMGHEVQAVTVDAGDTLEYDPTAHAVQPEVPVEILLYEPAAQPMHAATEVAPVTFEYIPAAHAVHEADVRAATNEPYLPAAQPVQLEVPVVSPL